ncbi:MAG: imidazolonepropionase, partial [Polaromonas sp.]
MSLQLWSNCRAATLQAGAAQPYGLIEDAALVVQGESIVWVGPRTNVPADLLARCTVQHDAGGTLITPGLIDCHTHLVYGGDRAHEFELRLNGVTYEEIARTGGGIASTMQATRAATAPQLQAQSATRLQRLIAEGVTTLEIKSGYGLALEHERKILSVARALGQAHAVDIRTTFLGAHAVPAEFAGRTDAYVDAVLEMLPVLHAEGLVDAVDAFCERIAFSPAQTERVFVAARALGIPVKLHAEQLSDSGGAQLAARYGALSCDHLEWLSAEGAQAMAAAGSVAVLLPGAFYFLRETKLPPVALLREHGVPMAISTDCNP